MDRASGNLSRRRSEEGFGFTGTPPFPRHLWAMWSVQGFSISQYRLTEGRMTSALLTQRRSSHRIRRAVHDDHKAAKNQVQFRSSHADGRRRARLLRPMPRPIFKPIHRYRTIKRASEDLEGTGERETDHHGNPVRTTSRARQSAGLP